MKEQRDKERKKVRVSLHIFLSRMTFEVVNRGGKNSKLRTLTRWLDG